MNTSKNKNDQKRRFDENKKNPDIESDPFWKDSPSILLQYNRLSEFFPIAEMTLIEKLNAIMRLTIYVGVILFLATQKYPYLFIPIVAGVITISIYQYKDSNFELFNSSIKGDIKNQNNEKILKEKKCIKPTYNNPFMNYNIITDFPRREPACPSWNNDKVKEDIEDKFHYNLYRDVSDMYGKSNSQRQYYTMPSTTNPNNQTMFAKWCFNTGPTCKEDTIRCVPQYTFYETGEDFQRFLE